MASAAIFERWVGPIPCSSLHGQGSRVFDVDGNEYIDFTLAQGPLILGHSHPDLLRRVSKELSRGQLFAAQFPLELELAKRLSEILPCAERMRFCNTGSEAVHAALRLARGVTGKTKILKFEGHYHGWFDNVLVSIHPSPEAAGARKPPFGRPPEWRPTLIGHPGSSGLLLERTGKPSRVAWSKIPTSRPSSRNR